jgi:hypothetical protein
MPKQGQYTPPTPLHKLLMSFVLGILLYPYSVIKKYNDYNIRITEIANELKDVSIFRIKKNNIKLIFIFIHLPLIIGSIFLLVSSFSNSSEFYKFYKILTYENKVLSPTIFDQISFLEKKLSFAFDNFPIRKNQLSYIIFSYFISLVGAKFLSLHTAFVKEEEIKTIFSNLGYIDGEGKPWKVTWTPDAIQIVSFNCDPIQLCANNRFWSTINFPPGTPRVSKLHMNKFIVTRAYELNSNIIFT